MRISITFLLVTLCLVLLNRVDDNLRHGKDGVGASQWVSDWYWIQGYGDWLNRDEPRLLDNYSFATGLDPENLVYWRLAAQTIAFDLPSWKADEEPEADFKKQYGKLAVEFFERSRGYFPEEPKWFQTGSFIAETVVGDPSLALSYLKDGVSLKTFPYFMGRSYVRLLEASGDLEAALSFLRTWLPRLEDDPYQERYGEVQNWILSLENQLNTSHSK